MMNELQNYKETVTMTSLEIAELTGKEHRNILRDIEEQLSKVSPLLRFEQSYVAENGHTYKTYCLPKRETLILVSGYSVTLRAKIIDRLETLEQDARYKGLPNFCNPAEAARAWADEIDRNKALETKIVADTPKVEYYNQLVAKNMLTSFRDTAKELGVKEKAFISYLLTRGFVYRDRKGKLKPYAQYSNLFSIKEYINDTTGRVGNQTFVTPKGREHLLELLDDPSVQHYLTCSTK